MLERTFTIILFGSLQLNGKILPAQLFVYLPTYPTCLLRKDQYLTQRAVNAMASVTSDHATTNTVVGAKTKARRSTCDPFWALLLNESFDDEVEVGLEDDQQSILTRKSYLSKKSHVSRKSTLSKKTHLSSSSKKRFVPLTSDDHGRVYHDLPERSLLEDDASVQDWELLEGSNSMENAPIVIKSEKERQEYMAYRKWRARKLQARAAAHRDEDDSMYDEESLYTEYTKGNVRHDEDESTASSVDDHPFGSRRAAEASSKAKRGNPSPSKRRGSLSRREWQEDFDRRERKPSGRDRKSSSRERDPSRHKSSSRRDSSRQKDRNTVLSRREKEAKREERPSSRKRHSKRTTPEEKQSKSKSSGKRSSTKLSLKLKKISEPEMKKEEVQPEKVAVTVAPQEAKDKDQNDKKESQALPISEMDERRLEELPTAADPPFELLPMRRVHSYGSSPVSHSLVGCFAPFQKRIDTPTLTVEEQQPVVASSNSRQSQEMIEEAILNKVPPKTKIPRVPSPVTQQTRDASSFEDYDQVDAANDSFDEVEDTVDEMKEDPPEKLLTTASARTSEQKEDLVPEARDEVVSVEEEREIQDKPLQPKSYSSKGEKTTHQRTMLPPLRATIKEVQRKSSPPAFVANDYDTPSAVRIAQGPVTWNKDRILKSKETKGKEVISRPPKSSYSGDRESAYNTSPSSSSKRWEGGVSKIDVGFPKPSYLDDGESAHSKSPSIASKRWEGGVKKTVWKSDLFQRIRSGQSTNVKSVDRGSHGVDEDTISTKIERATKKRLGHRRSRSVSREITR
jgi:hypothetical protein